MAKNYIVYGTVTHRVRAYVTVAHEDELDDAIEEAMTLGNYCNADFYGYTADTIEPDGDTHTLVEKFL